MPSKVIIVCGGRDYNDAQKMRSVLAQYRVHNPTIRHGAYRGADTLANEAALSLGYEVDPWPADWDRYGPSAGPRRNRAMAEAEPKAWLCICFPGGRGTDGMRQLALANGISCLLPYGYIFAPRAPSLPLFRVGPGALCGSAGDRTLPASARSLDGVEGVERWRKRYREVPRRSMSAR